MRKIEFRVWDKKGLKNEKGEWIRKPQMYNVVRWEHTSDDYDTLICDSLKMCGKGKFAVSRERVAFKNTDIILKLLKEENNG